MNAALASILVRAAFIHHADPPGVYQPHGVSIVLECSTSELLARAAFKHYADQGHTALKYYAVLKGVGTPSELLSSYQ